MSSTEKVSESVPRVFRDKNYVFDENLEIIRHGSASEQTFLQPVPSTFPNLKTFAHLAYVAYYDHHGDGSLKVPLEEQVQLDGFTFLAAANNSAKWNGYYGIAYVNEERRQIILSHRGTDPSTAGALYADFNGIVRKNFVPQVSSAMTFAHKVVDHAVRRGYEFFFTGHSLGAWLAQITTFSTMYLTLDEVTGHFVGKQSPHSDVRMPYTVVFDSPGALNYLTLLKQALFHLHVESTQEISVEALPVEVFLFHPNYVNSIDLQIGRVFILDVAKAEVDTKKYFGKGTHGVGPVVRLLKELREEDAVKLRVTDYRVGKTDVAMNSWGGRDRTVPWDKSSVPLYFFSREERRFLEGAKRDFPSEGQFEGVNLSDEETANSLVGVTSENSLWKLKGGEESVVNCEEWDRRELIPRVRHIVRCLRQRGTLWWNPRRSELPRNYVDRRICPTAKLKEFTALPAYMQMEQNEIKAFSATEVLMKKARLVLFVDPPGMGKSSAMTQLEIQLRSQVSLSPRVILRLNLNKVQEILHSEDAEQEITENAMRFIEKFMENIRVPLLQQTFPVKLLPLYVLLDGLDEVCPLYEGIMLRLLRLLLADTPQRLFSVCKVVLTTRPHLRKLIEDAFDVQTNSLLPLQFEEQAEFLHKEVGVSVDRWKSLISLPDTARSLMENPLMLSLYAQVLKSQGTKALVNTFDLYSQFVAAKHELHVVEKEEAEPAKMSTQRRVSSMLDDNLKFYFACAVHELLGSLKAKAISGKKKASDSEEGFLKLPTGKKLDELISYGLLVSGGRFKHRSFAEFFYAQLLTREAQEYKQFREILFGRMYEDNVNKNMEKFVVEILLRRQVERTGMESPESFLKFCLREEEAALYLGKERLEILVNGWIDSLGDMKRTLRTLLMEMKQPFEGIYTGPKLISPLQNVGGELAGADDKESALRQFYSGTLFVFLCGRSVLLCLNYSNPEIFDSIKSRKYIFGLFWSWLCGLDRKWVRAKVFGMNDERVGEGHLLEGSAEVILMMTVRTDDVSQFLSDDEISAALNSLDSVVDDDWRKEDVEVENIRRTLEKYVDPARLQRSLLAHLTTGDDTLLKTFSKKDPQGMDFRWSWWYAEVFSRSDVLSFVSPYASRLPRIPGISWRTVQGAWGEEFVPAYEGKTLLHIKEGDFACLSNLWDEVERGGLKLEGDLLDAVREMIFGGRFGWKVLEMLERRLVRLVGTNVNSCLSQKTNSASLLEQLFECEDVGTKIFDALRPYTNLHWDVSKFVWEERDLFNWLPFVVRYSGEPENIKRIIARLSFCTYEICEDNFASAAYSFLVAHSLEAAGSSSVPQLIRSYLQAFKTKHTSLLNVLLDADEGELRTLIKENSPATPPTVTHTPLGSLLICFLNKKATSDESKSTPPWRLTTGSSLDAESVAFIFTALIDTSTCSELPRALGNFLSSFSHDLIKEALLSRKLKVYLQSKRRVDFRKFVFVNTERICRLRATFRCYFVVFGEDLKWTETKIYNEDLLTWMPVEILSVLEDREESTLEGFKSLQIGTKVDMVKKLEKILWDKIINQNTLSSLAEKFSYQTEADWERLLQAVRIIPLRDSDVTGCTSAVVDHIHHFVDIVDSRLALLRVWVKHFGAEGTRRAADEQNLWEYLRTRGKVPRGEYLHAAVEVGSLPGVKTLAWPGLLKWKNKGGKTAGEVSVELWGIHHEISLFLEERFQAVRAFQVDPQ